MEYNDPPFFEAPQRCELSEEIIHVFAFRDRIGPGRSQPSRGPAPRRGNVRRRGGAASCGAGSAAASEKRTIAAGKVLDLTHTLSPAFPIWPGNVPIKVTNAAKVAKDGFYANRWELAEHHGTHLDAPAHFASGGLTAERLEASSLVVSAAVIDIRERAARTWTLS